MPGQEHAMQRRSFLGSAAAALLSPTLVRAASPRDWSVPPHYPDPDIVALDPRFRFGVGTGGIERLVTGNRWCEGLVYFRDLRCLIWSDIPNNRMMRWNEEDGSVSVFRQPSNYANGNTRDREGRLVTCEHDTRRVTRTEHDGRITVILDRFDGKPLNSPNDLIVSSDGAIWFTDPGFGILGNYESSAQREFELPTNVYRVDPASGVATVVASDFVRPNGLALSPDEKQLYVVEGGRAAGVTTHIRVFDVNGKRLVKGRVFAEMGKGTSDGIRTDVHGNVWCTYGWADRTEDGVRCYATDGALIGKVLLPETPGNLTFGGPKRNRLMVCASTSIYAVYLNNTGAQVP
jgi:gluconolactonase